MKAPSIARDSRGAMMVLGLFFCSILTGGLWYLAGLGDAILFRERATEAADAVAFTSSAVHARGMNIIVLLNLTMAAVLAIRVVLKALLAIEIIAEVVFGLICLNPFGGEWACAALPMVGEAISFTQNAINATRQPINQALTSMSKTQEVISRVIPPAALAASTAVGRKYTPTVKLALGVPQPTLTQLPVEAGTASYLCREAGRALGDFAAFILEKAGLGGLGTAVRWIADRVGGIVAAAPGYFCEIPNAPAPPKGNDITNAAKDHCQQMKDSGDAGKGFDQKKCEKDKEKELNDKAKAKTPGAGNAPWDKMLGKKPAADYGQGCPGSETVGVAAVDDKRIAGDRKMVAVGHFGGPTGSPSLAVAGAVGDVMGVLPDAFTQAEFFYDCKGQWTGKDCNRDGEDAMWHFRWRPRLVLYDNTHKLFKAPAQVLAVAFGVRVPLDAAGYILVRRKNQALVRELIDASKNPKTLYVH